MDDQNNPVFCDPGIGALQTADDRVFTTTVTPQTDRVAHSYTLTLTVPGGRVQSSVGSKPNEEPRSRSRSGCRHWGRPSRFPPWVCGPIRGAVR